MYHMKNMTDGVNTPFSSPFKYTYISKPTFLLRCNDLPLCLRIRCYLKRFDSDYRVLMENARARIYKSSASWDRVLSRICEYLSVYYIFIGKYTIVIYFYFLHIYYWLLTIMTNVLQKIFYFCLIHSVETLAPNPRISSPNGYTRGENSQGLNCTFQILRISFSCELLTLGLGSPV